MSWFPPHNNPIPTGGMPDHAGFTTVEALWIIHILQDIERKVNAIMSTVADLTAAQAALTDAVSALSAAQAKALADLQAEVAALQAAQPNLDLTGINNAISALSGLTTTVTAADPGPQPTA